MTQSLETFAAYKEKYMGSILAVVDEVVADEGLAESSIAKMLDYQIKTGGKRLRAILPLMVAEALEADPQNLVPFGALCELIHNATLVHDDLQDGDRMRRGKPTIWLRFGQAQAINLGDALLYLAPLCMEYVDVDDARRWAVSRRIFRQILQVIDGQEREFALKTSEATWNDYERMVVGKTSGLFALPMAGAAELCGAPDTIVDALLRVSEDLGVIFQIQDDILDLYGEKGRRAPGGDLREGKVSALVLNFAKKGRPAEVARLGEILAKDRDATTEADVTWAIDIIRSRGALEATLEILEERRRRILSMDVISTLPRLGEVVSGLVDVFLEPIGELTS